MTSSYTGITNIEANQDEDLDYIYPRFLATLALDGYNLNDAYKFNDIEDDLLTEQKRGFRIYTNERMVDDTTYSIDSITTIDYPTSTSLKISPSATNFYSFTPEEGSEFSIILKTNEFYHEEFRNQLGLIVVRVSDTTGE
jgi:hypothetical protein